MADILDARCTCERWWRGHWPRPWCTVHERAAKIVADAEAYLAVMSDEPPAPWRPREWRAA